MEEYTQTLPENLKAKIKVFGTSSVYRFGDKK